MIKVPGLEQYFGGKNGSGTPQQIINLQPVHTVYIEGFLGSGAIMKRKKPAKINIGIDLDVRVIHLWQKATLTKSNYQILLCNALQYLQDLKHYIKINGWDPKEVLIYLDPPYPSETRTDYSGSQYLFEMQGDSQDELLKTILTLECMVMISTYPNPQYRKIDKNGSHRAQCHFNKHTETSRNTYTRNRTTVAHQTIITMDYTPEEKQYQTFLSDVKTHGISYMTGVGKHTKKLLPGDVVPDSIVPGFVPKYRTLNRRERKAAFKNRETQK